MALEDGTEAGGEAGLVGEGALEQAWTDQAAEPGDPARAAFDAIGMGKLADVVVGPPQVARENVRDGVRAVVGIVLADLVAERLE